MKEQLLLPYFYKGIIYQIVNIQNKKSYIGKTGSINFYNYIKNHFRNAVNNIDNNKKLFYRAIRKYGKENFKIIILGEIYVSNLKELNKKLNDAEIECIEFFKSNNSIYGYNMTKGGDGGDTLSNHPNKDILFKDRSGKTIEERFGKEKAEKIKYKMKQSWSYEKIITPEAIKKRVKTLKVLYSDPIWQNTIGKEKNNKIREKRKYQIITLESNIKRSKTIKGSKWMYINEKSTMVKPFEINKYINLGYKLGRKELKRI